jgi:hypothetical protein
MTTDENIPNRLELTVGDTVSLTINDWVNEAKTHCRLIAGYTKEMEHWQKRELESAIICGSNLVKIRMSYGDRGIGFKPFIEKEFENEFSYKTCLRYMKLSNRSSEIPSDVNNIRQAYIRLGILQEDYSYPKPESNNKNNSGTNGKPSDGASKDNNTKGKPKSPKRTLNDLLPIGDSIFMTLKNDKKIKDDSSHEICEFKLNPDGALLGRPVVKTGKYSIIKPAGVEFFLKKLTPYVEWYLRQSYANVSKFPAPADTNTLLAA